MKYIELLIIASLIFSTFFLAIRGFSEYILPVIKNKHNAYIKMKTIDQLIESTKGRFFSITFEKKDGTLRVVNGKDKYLRLIRGEGSPATDGLKERGYKSAVNRNRESWFSFMPEKVIEFKCGSIKQTF